MWDLCLSLIILIPSTLEHSHQGALDTYRVSAGHFLRLECGLCNEEVCNVTWRRGGLELGLPPGVEVWEGSLDLGLPPGVEVREGSLDLGLPPGVEVREGSLWFLPVLPHHSGLYTCETRDYNKSWEIEFLVSVDQGPCPQPSEFRYITQGTNDYIPCKQFHVFNLDPSARIQWFKDCVPVRGYTSVLRVSNASEEAAGVYTCRLDFTLQGLNYTASRSMELRISHDEVLQKPQVTYPRQEHLTVEPGSPMQLSCSALGGVEDIGHWTVNGKHSSTYEQLSESWDYVYESQRVYLQSNLTISEVLQEFLDVPLKCVVENPLDRDVGVVWLHPADHSGLYTCVTLPLLFPVVILAVVAGFLLRVDLVLVYRKLRPRVFRRRTPDGKLYDAFVSYLHGDVKSSSSAMTFALQMLPKVLEKQHGYSLYIRGRDDTPGEATHDAVARAMESSRRLIVVLSAESRVTTATGMEEEGEEEEEERSLLLQVYEQRLGLHLALVHPGLQVVLVEVDPHVDYSLLPESLRYLHRKQGALRWRRSPEDSHAAPSGGRFWKCLRYHMPSEPVEKPLITV